MAKKCDICGKKVAECGPGQDENKFCQGHTRSERAEYDKWEEYYKWQ